MKERISQFICFYLTVPLFVLFSMIFGTVLFGSIGKAASGNEEISENNLSHVIEAELFPSGMLDEIILPDSNMHPIVSKTIASKDNILNETFYNINEEEIISHSPSYDYTNSEPLVLVVHTHGTECYFDEEEEIKVYYTSSGDTVEGYYNEKETETRTKDKEKNVVAVGKVFCETLEEFGVSSIHCTQMFDEEDYNSAYSNSGKAIEKYLEEYPSIKLVIDLHRDSLVSNDLVKVRTVTSGLENRCAQVMIVAGSDAGGSYYPNWKRNLALDIEIKAVMDQKYPTLSRPVFLRGARYNQHLGYTGLLLEVGTCANTLKEAKTAAKLAAECIATVIKGS